MSQTPEYPDGRRSIRTPGKSNTDQHPDGTKCHTPAQSVRPALDHDHRKDHQEPDRSKHPMPDLGSHPRFFLITSTDFWSHRMVPDRRYTIPEQRRWLRYPQSHTYQTQDNGRYHLSHLEPEATGSVFREFSAAKPTEARCRHSTGMRPEAGPAAGTGALRKQHHHPSDLHLAGVHHAYG